MAAEFINLDNNATTPVFPEVWEAIRAAPPGNSSSMHAHGRGARKAFDDAKERVAARLGANADEVIFTSGATEANNLAIFGLAGDPPATLATSHIEHSCVAEPFKQLGQRGHNLVYLPVKSDGTVDVKTIPPATRLVAVMCVNHETGAIQPKVPAGPWHWHCDVAQAVGKIPVNFHQLGASTAALSGHKFGAPQGIGVLLVRKGAHLRPHLLGGPHQQGRRPGTEPVALAVGLATALDIVCNALEQRREHVASLRALSIERLTRDAQPCVINSPRDGSPYVVNASFPGIRSDQLLMAFDLAGVACSAGPACSSGTVKVSATLTAMGLAEDVLKSAVRFSFWPDQTVAEIETATKRIVATVRRLRGG